MKVISRLSPLALDLLVLNRTVVLKGLLLELLRPEPLFVLAAFAVIQVYSGETCGPWLVVEDYGGRGIRCSMARKDVNGIDQHR